MYSVFATLCSSLLLFSVAFLAVFFFQLLQNWQVSLRLLLCCTYTSSINLNNLKTHIHDPFTSFRNFNFVTRNNSSNLFYSISITSPICPHYEPPTFLFLPSPKIVNPYNPLSVHNFLYSRSLDNLFPTS